MSKDLSLYDSKDEASHPATQQSYICIFYCVILTVRVKINRREWTGLLLEEDVWTLTMSQGPNIQHPFAADIPH